MQKTNDIVKRFHFCRAQPFSPCLLRSLKRKRGPTFRQPPAWTTPSMHGLSAQVGDVDDSLISNGPAGLTIPLPGQPDLVLERGTHERRGARSSVWRGRGEFDRDARRL